MSNGVMAWRGAVRAVSSTTASTSSFASVTRRVGVGGAARGGGGSARRVGIPARDPGDEERVTSTDNATVKHFAKLVKSKAHRDASGSVVVAGAGMLEEIYADGGVEDARVVFLGEDAETPRGMRARRIVRAPEHVLKKAAGLQSVDRVDIVAELATPPLDGIEALGGVASTATRVLALDGIQDPGNLGTLTRTALALGWDAVALLPGTCDPFNDKVRLETKTRKLEISHPRVIPRNSHVRQRKTRGVVSLRFARRGSRSRLFSD
jgi:tRNA G18 (ribose-2'-O)-methylase SpoU